MPIKRLIRNISSFSLKKLRFDLQKYSMSIISKKRFAVFVFLLVFSLSICVWQNYIKSERKKLQSLITTDLKLIRSRLDAYFENKLNRLEFLAEKISRHSIEEVDLNSYGNMGFDFIAFVNKDFAIDKINKKDLTGLYKQNIALDESDKLNLIEFETNKKKTISSKLHIHGRGKEVNFLIPVLEEKEIEGFILGSIKVKNLMDYMLSDLSNKLSFKVYEDEQLLYQNTTESFKLDKKSIYWDLDPASVYATELLPISSTETIRVIASPSKALLGSFNTLLDKYVLFLGFLFSCLFALSFYYVTSSKIVFNAFEELIENLDEQIQENDSLKSNLTNLSNSAEKYIHERNETFKFHKSAAYKVMQEAIKSKKEQESIGKHIERNSNRLKLAIESAGIGTWTWDIQEDKIVWDEFTHKIFGVSKDRSIASYEKFLEKVALGDQERVDSEIKKVFSQGGNLNCSFKVVRADGYEKQISLKAKAFLGTNSEPMHMTGIVQDTSYEVNNSALLNSFFSLPIVMFCVADMRGNFKILNSAWSDVLGYSVAELKTNPFMYFVHPRDRNKTQIEYQLLMGEGGYRTINFENRYKCKDGNYKTLMWNAIKLSGNNMIYAIAWDITGTIKEREFLEFEDHRAAF